MRAKRILVSVVPSLLAVLVYPLVCALALFLIAVGRFCDMSVLLAYAPLRAGEILRYLYYWTFLKRIGKGVTFRFGSYCQYQESEIGNNVLIGYFNALGLVSIGDDVLFGGYVNCLSGLHQHGFSDARKRFVEQPGQRERIVIGNNIWVGSNSVLCANVCDNCVLGVGSLVVKAILKRGVYVGSPAKLVKKLD
jgi:acetyltransferase-like isoleucine patch superfamily enzyme